MVKSVLVKERDCQVVALCVCLDAITSISMLNALYTIFVEEILKWLR